jgi:ATP phosphoribosyltransferase regulatory subunit
MTGTISYRPPTRDLLPLDVFQKSWVEDRLRQVFQRWGYQQIITPTLERLETLTAEGLVQPAAILQIRDAEGMMLGLRPEFTASIVRAAATRMSGSPMPYRLYYQDNVFRNTQREPEFFQSGVELIGAGNWVADGEILLLLADCLSSLKVDTWQLVIGDVGITESLLNLISPTAREPIRQAITRLDPVYLESADLPEVDRQMGLYILKLRGYPGQVFSQLSQVSLFQRERITALQNVCRLLEEQQVSVILDLSLIQRFAYYTGIVFQVVSHQDVIGSGGRYDQLYGLYSPQGIQQPGIGFTLLLEKLQRILALSGSLPQQLPAVDRLLVPVDEQALPLLLKLAHQWRQSERIEIELNSRSPEELESYARERRIREISWIQADGSYHSSRLGE